MRKILLMSTKQHQILSIYKIALRCICGWRVLLVTAQKQKPPVGGLTA
jgi:hypothetical protein